MLLNPHANGSPQGANAVKSIAAVLIDPDVLLTDCLRPMLSNSSGVTISHTAESMEQGLTLIRQLRPQVVILDSRMFEEGFRALCDELSVRLDQTKLGVFADQMSDSRREHAVASHVRGLFSKRCTREDLATGISQIASGSYYVAPNLMERVDWDGPATRPRFPMQNRIQALTDRQLQVLMHLAEGSTVREIAGKTNLSEKAIESHKFRIMSRLGIKNRVQLSRWAIREGLISA
jgi:DNA-binding NarL/FixJ family response regulator